MEAAQIDIEMSPCSCSLPELEVPMISTMVSCLCSEHRSFNDLTMHLAFAATRLASDSDADTAMQQAIEAWDEIRRDLWSHLQIEDELVFSWSSTHDAIPSTSLDKLRIERQEMRDLLAALQVLAPDATHEALTNRGALARTLLALAHALDAHVERYDREVLPSIIRTLQRI